MWITAHKTDMFQLYLASVSSSNVLVSHRNQTGANITLIHPQPAHLWGRVCSKRRQATVDIAAAMAYMAIKYCCKRIACLHAGHQKVLGTGAQTAPINEQSVTEIRLVPTLR
jgi:hypothetical protein